MLQAAGKKTAAAIRRAFVGEGYDISLDTAKQLQTLYRDAAGLPTEYFEAKPRRAVGFDEVKAAILPDNVSDSVRGQLEKLGVPVIEYKAGDEDARLKALNSVEDVKFSRKKQTAAEQIVGEATEKEQLKKQLMAAETEKRELARKYTKARESADYSGNVNTNNAINAWRVAPIVCVWIPKKPARSAGEHLRMTQ